MYFIRLKIANNIKKMVSNNILTLSKKSSNNAKWILFTLFWGWLVTNFRNLTQNLAQTELTVRTLRRSLLFGASSSDSLYFKNFCSLLNVCLLTLQDYSQSDETAKDKESCSQRIFNDLRKQTKELKSTNSENDRLIVIRFYGDCYQ